MWNFLIPQPGLEGKNCIADEHYLPTFFQVRIQLQYIYFIFYINILQFPVNLTYAFDFRLLILVELQTGQ